jgi:selenocysteine lyase/cysteine desulfurase
VAGLCRPALAALAAYWEAQSHNGIYSELAAMPVIETNRQHLADLIGAEPGEIAWLQNTSDAIALVANALRWTPGDNLITTDEQFPANIYPWLALRDEGVETRLVARREGRVRIPDLVARMDDRTRLVAVSWIEYNSGYRQDIPTLARICHERGIRLLVDAIQGIGGLQADVHAWDADFVAGGVQKWLLGPQGLAFLYIRAGALDALRPRQVGWRSVPDMLDFANYGQPWLPTAQRFEGGTPNMGGHIAFAPILDLLREVGLARIEAQILALTAHLMDRLRATGHTVVSSDTPNERSGIVCFAPRNGEASLDVVARLEAAQISVAARGAVVRVSPHFYNTATEIDSLFTPGLLG